MGFSDGLFDLCSAIRYSVSQLFRRANSQRYEFPSTESRKAVDVLLCREPGVPHKGWRWQDVTDSRDDTGLAYDEYGDCQFCGREKIRFVHLIAHDEWRGIIRVGCICAEKSCLVKVGYCKVIGHNECRCAV